MKVSEDVGSSGVELDQPSETCSTLPSFTAFVGCRALSKTGAYVGLGTLREFLPIALDRRGHGIVLVVEPFLGRINALSECPLLCSFFCKVQICVIKKYEETCFRPAALLRTAQDITHVC